MINQTQPTQPLSATGGQAFNGGAPLTPEQVQVAQSSLGIGNQTNSTSSQASMPVAQRIASLGINEDGTPINQPRSSTSTQDTRAWYDPRRLLDAPARLASEVGQGEDIAGTKLAELFMGKDAKSQQESKLNTMTSTSQNVPLLGTQVPALKDLNAEQVGGQVLGTVGLATGNPLIAGATMGAGGAMENKQGIGGIALDTVIGAVAGKVLEGGFKLASPYIDAAIQKYGTPAFEKLSNYIPEAVKGTYKTMADKVSTTLKPMNDAANNIDKYISGKVSDITKKPVTAITNKVKDVLELPTHTLDQLKSIPESEVGKLNIREQNAWAKIQKKDILGAKKDLILDTGKETETALGANKAQQDIATKAAEDSYNKDVKNLTNVSDALDKKLTESSLKTAVEERPTMQKLLKTQGDTYEKLYNADVKPVKNVKLNKDEVFAKIDSKLPGTIDTSERDVANKIKAAIKFDKNGNIKLGELNAQIKALKVGKVKGGFNQTQVQINDAISGVGELMQEKGADFSKSNTFWKKWVGVKDKIIQKFNPFESSPINAKAGGDLIRGIAEGKMPEEKEFMNIVRENIGRDLTTKEKGIVSKIKLNKDIIGEHGEIYKQKIAAIDSEKTYQDAIAKHQEEVDKGLIDGATQEKLDKLEATKWESRVKAATRKVVAAILTYAGIKVGEAATGVHIPYVPGL
jgi:hypothetical protein